MKSWKDVKPGDLEWELKVELDRKIARLNKFTAVVVALAVIALLVERLFFQ